LGGQIKEDEWKEHASCTRGLKIVQSLIRKRERKRPLGRPRNRLEDNIKIDLK